MKIDNILKNFDLIEDKEIAKLEEINFKYPFFSNWSNSSFKRLT